MVANAMDTRWSHQSGHPGDAEVIFLRDHGGNLFEVKKAAGS